MVAAIAPSRHDARRAAILDAALGVFLEHGVEAAPVDEIRARSGASVGSLYHRFGSKEGIAAALYVDTLAGYQRGFLAVLDRGRGTEETVRAVVRAHLRWVEANADRAQYLFMGRAADVRLAADEDLRELNAGFFAAVLAWVKPRTADGELRRAPFATLHALWLGPSQELSRHWLADGRRGRLSAQAPLLAGAAWRSLEAGA